MDIKDSIKDQYHSALAMLREAIIACPPDVWVAGKEPRSFWRIAYHALFYTHWYLHRNSMRFIRWEGDRKGCASLIAKPSRQNMAPYSKEEILDYWALVEGFVNGAVDSMDLSASTCGFWWYKMPKLNHQIMNIRHLQQHTGQLSEILMAHGVDTSWVGDTLP